MLRQRDSFLQAVKLEAAILILTKCKNGVEVWKRWIHMVGGFWVKTFRILAHGMTG